MSKVVKKLVAALMIAGLLLGPCASLHGFKARSQKQASLNQVANLIETNPCGWTPGRSNG